MAFISVVLLVGYCTVVRTKELWLLLLYVFVTVVNVGYFMLSLSKTVGFAIFANDVVYLGSIFIAACMLMTIVKLCGFEMKKGFGLSLIAVGTVMFCIVATSGILPWYYKEVSLTFVDGAATLEKVYGVLHPVYLVYVLAYFSAMVFCIVYSIRKRAVASRKQAVLLAVIVFGNIAVWLVEKFVPWNFEFLSVTYLFSEVILLSLYWMMQDYVHVAHAADFANGDTGVPGDASEKGLEEKFALLVARMSENEELSLRESEILRLILQNKKRKEIAEELHLSENTIKTHTRTLYSKLSVSSREDIHALIEEKSS